MGKVYGANRQGDPMRLRSMALALVVIGAVGGCGGAPDVEVREQLSEPLGDDYVLLATSDAVYGVPVDGGAPSHWSGAVAAANRSQVVSAQPSAAGTSVAAVTPGAGTKSWSRSLDGSFGVRVVSADGRYAALGPGAITGTAYAAQGRTTTPIVVVGSGEPRRYDLAGNYEPEAFTADSSALVLIEYLPPENPDQYSIRLLDLGTGEVGGVPDVDGSDREPMRGTARTSVMSADGTRLYTFYSAPEGALVHGQVYKAFVHVLDLDEVWAHCVGLDAPFEGASVALGLSPDGSRLFVADPAAGAIAELDSGHSALRRIVSIPAVPVGGPASLAVGEDSLYVAHDTSVVAYDLEGLEPGATWTPPDLVLGLRSSTGGADLFASLPERVAALDPRALTPTRWYDVPGAVDIRSADPANRPGARDEIQCAC
jgi:hypothetical protein